MPGALASQDKAKLIEALLDTVAKQTDEILKSEWVKTLATRFDVTQESVLRQLRKKSACAPAPRRDAAGANAGAPVSKHGAGPALPEVPAIELGFIHLLIKDPALIATAKDLTEADFQSPVSKRIFSAVKDLAGEDPSKTIPRLVELFPEYTGIVMKLSVEELGADMNTPQNAAQAAQTLRKLSLERKRKELKSRMGSLTQAEMAEYIALMGIEKGIKAKTD